jgi:hypothetical protein
VAGRHGWEIVETFADRGISVSYRNADYSTDQIMKPGEGHAWCWRVPVLDDSSVDWRTLEWSVTTAVSFE